MAGVGGCDSRIPSGPCSKNGDIPGNEQGAGNAGEDALGAPDNGIPGSDLTTRVGSFAIHGRGERIRTSGPCLPKAVLYQAELHPDAWTDPGLDHTWKPSESLRIAPQQFIYGPSPFDDSPDTFYCFFPGGRFPGLTDHQSFFLYPRPGKT